MNIVPVVMEIIDPYTRSYRWTEIAAGDLGEPVCVWAWPHMAWHMTGYWTVNTDNASIHIMGSNDSTCFSRLHTMVQPSNEDDPPEYIDESLGTVSHNFTDYAVNGDNFPRLRWMAPRRPRDGGTHKDVQVILFCSRPWLERL